MVCGNVKLLRHAKWKKNIIEGDRVAGVSKTLSQVLTQPLVKQNHKPYTRRRKGESDSNKINSKTMQSAMYNKAHQFHGQKVEGKG